MSERDADAARSAEAAQRLAAAANHEQRLLRQLQVTLALQFIGWLVRVQKCVIKADKEPLSCGLFQRCNLEPIM